MPCKPAIARLQLKGGKTEVKNRVPFTIKLVKDSTEFKQLITAVMDTGNKFLGVCSLSLAAKSFTKAKHGRTSSKTPQNKQKLAYWGAIRT